MKTALLIAAMACVVTAPVAAPVAAQAAPETNQPRLTGFPFTDEDLNYTIVWPTGISLGDAHLHARRAGQKWNFSFTLDAGIPGYTVKDSYRSDVDPGPGSDYCTTAFDRSSTHGARVMNEKETVDRARGVAIRPGKDGAKVEIPVQSCVKDALAYLFYARQEMGQGRVPSAQDVLLGALHPIRVDYDGGPVITMNGKQVQSDKVTCTWRNGDTAYSFEVYFARDAARTPLRITAPFAVGTFSMDLVR